MIILYANSCEGCSGNNSVNRIKTYCRNQGVEFEQRLTPLWRRYKQEADAIEKATGEKLPVFYGTECKKAVKASSLAPTEKLQKLVDAEKEVADL